MIQEKSRDREHRHTFRGENPYEKESQHQHIKWQLKGEMGQNNEVSVCVCVCMRVCVRQTWEGLHTKARANKREKVKIYEIIIVADEVRSWTRWKESRLLVDRLAINRKKEDSILLRPQQERRCELGG